MAKFPKLDGSQEYWSANQAEEMTTAAADAQAAWHKSRAKSAEDYVAVCARVAAFTDAKVKPTKEQLDAFWKRLGDPNPFTKSAMRTIGEQAEALRRHAAHLPTAQEAIKELARAEKKKGGAIDSVMTALDENSSVADVRKAVRPYVGGSTTDQAPTSNEHLANLVSTKIDQAVAVLSSALTANTAIRVEVGDDRELADRLIKSLGKWSAVIDNAKRLKIDGEYPHNPLVSFEDSGKSKRLAKLNDEYEGRLWEAEQTAARKAIQRHYAKVEQRERAALKKIYTGLMAIPKAQFNKQLRRRMGWSLEDVDFTQGTPKDWVSAVNAMSHTLDEKQVDAAIAKATAKIKKPKALDKLWKEYDALNAKYPQPVEPYSPPAPVQSSFASLKVSLKDKRS